MGSWDLLTAYGGLLSLGIGLAGGGAITFLITWFTRPTKALAVAISTENMVKKLSSWVSDLSVTYQGRPVVAASVAKVVIWNDGRKELRKEDVAPAAPVRIAAKPPAQILSVTALSVSTPANSSTVSSLDPKGFAQVDFHYLNPRDALAVQVIHTGTVDGDLTVGGELIGGSPVRVTDPWRGWVYSLTAGILFVGSIALIFVVSLTPLGRNQWFFLAIFFGLIIALIVVRGRPVRLLLKPHLSMQAYVRPFGAKK